MPIHLDSLGNNDIPIENQILMNLNSTIVNAEDLWECIELLRCVTGRDKISIVEGLESTDGKLRMILNKSFKHDNFRFEIRKINNEEYCFMNVKLQDGGASHHLPVTLKLESSNSTDEQFGGEFEV